MMATSLIALFQYEEDFLAAGEGLKEAGFDRLSMMSPIPMHDAERVVGLDRSPVRGYSLVGGILGAISGFAMATVCALVFILPTDGRPVIAIPPFLIIAYEVTILLGILCTLLGFFIVAKLPAWTDAAYRMESNVDRFSLVVELGPDGDRATAERIIRDSGAEEVNEEEKRL